MRSRPPPSPPTLPMLLLRLLLPRETRDGVSADLEEIWAEKRQGSGRWAASRWLWVQVVHGVGPSARARWERSGYESNGDREGLMESIRQDIQFALTQLPLV